MTVKHVHVKQDCSPGKGTFLSEKDKVQHRTIYGTQYGIDQADDNRTFICW